ncbi:MAG: hypothetical protein PHW79_08535 [Candidatus Marinimicrobia bacterium]|nr:hypothetical protein [Candidatus Neomarinimicrobiota bacterium]
MKTFFSRHLLSILAIFVLQTVMFRTLTTAQTTDSTKTKIYLDSYRAALSDGELTPEESAMLKTLQKSLGLAELEIDSVKTATALHLPKMIDQSGRWPLVLQNMMFGVGLYGWAIPYVLDADEAKWYVAGEMISLSAAFWMTYQLTKKMEIPHARSQMIRYGSLVGALSGITLNEFLEPGDYTKVNCLIMMASIPAGAILGDRYYQKLKPSLGQSWAMTQWGEIGANTSREIFTQFWAEPEPPEYDWVNWDDWEDQDKAFQRDHQNWAKYQMLFYTMGYPLGTWVENKFFSDRQYTFGDGLMISWGRLTGMAYGNFLYDLISGGSNNSQTEGLFNAVGSIGGAVAMDRFILKKDYTTGQSILMVLGAISGGCFAAGIPIIFEVDDSRVYDIVAIGGSLGGYYLTDRVIDVRSEANSSLKETNSFSIAPTLIPHKNKILPGVHLSMTFD